MKSKKKKNKVSLREKMGKGTRLRDAQEWIGEYEGRALVQKYNKRYGLNSIVKAVDELLGLGVKLDKEYVARIRKSVENNLTHVMRKRESKAEQRKNDTADNATDMNDDA